MVAEHSLLQGIGEVGTISAALAVVIATWLLIYHASSSKNSRIAKAPVIVAGILVALGIMFRILFAPDLIADERAWHTRGLEAAEIIPTGDLESLGSFGKDGYPYLIGMLYLIVGGAPIVVLLLNIPFASLTVLFVSKTTGLIASSSLSSNSRDAAIRIAAWATALSPSFLFWAPRLLREALCVMLIAALVYAIARFIYTRHAGFLAVSLAPVLMLVMVRATVGLGIGLGALAGLILLRNSENQYRLFRIASTLPVLIIPTLAVWVFIDSNIGLSLEDTARINNSNSNNAESGYGTKISERNVGVALAANTLRAIVGPLPTEWSPQPVMLLAMQEGALWVGIVVCAVLGARILRHDDRAFSTVLVLALIAAALVLMFGYRVSNYGLLARMRPMGHVVLLPLAATYLGSVWQKSKERHYRKFQKQTAPTVSRNLPTI